jgi:predicted RNA-binding protein with PIN domain
LFNKEKDISSIIIDGYNLIGIDHGDLSAQREKLIRMLAEYGKTKRHDITVVFDGWKSGGQREQSGVIAGITVVYSRLGEKADSVIKRIICTGEKEWIVISSDREIADRAWSCGSVPVPSATFESFLAHPGKTVAGEFEPLEEDREVLHKRGRARTPSKKEKAVLRVLKKL